MAPLITCRLKACTSSSVMRPLWPVPLTCAMGTPSSRANLRTDGEACARPAMAGPGCWAGMAGGGAPAGAAAVGGGAGAGAGAATGGGGGRVGGGRLPPPCSPSHFERQQHRAFLDFVADLHAQFLD